MWWGSRYPTPWRKITPGSFCPLNFTVKFPLLDQFISVLTYPNFKWRLSFNFPKLIIIIFNNHNLPSTMRKCFSRVTWSFFGSRIFCADFLTSPCDLRPNIIAHSNESSKDHRPSTPLVRKFRHLIEKNATTITIHQRKRLLLLLVFAFLFMRYVSRAAGSLLC